jgi:hypothetical protein
MKNIPVAQTIPAALEFKISACKFKFNISILCFPRFKASHNLLHVSFRKFELSVNGILLPRVFTKATLRSEPQTPGIK